MGVDSTIDENDFGDELNSKGFLLANFDKLITWARTGSHPQQKLWFTVFCNFKRK
ncbi:MAG: hypothetical protein MK015_00060 [Alphaproteobacteria bacterium]|jgi:hypothetical protein|nr:hypothetical protein [Alphaproteobacteria bacterium]